MPTISTIFSPPRNQTQKRTRFQASLTAEDLNTALAETLEECGEDPTQWIEREISRNELRRLSTCRLQLLKKQIRRKENKNNIKSQQSTITKLNEI